MVKKIWEFYQYLFYKYTTWSAWLNFGLNPFPYHGGWGFLSLLSFANLLSLVYLLQIFTGYGIKQTANLPVIIIIVVITIICIINYYLFLKDSKYKKIIKKYESEGKRSRIRGNIVAWSCIILTILINFSSAYILGKVRPHNDNYRYAIFSDYSHHFSNAYDHLWSWSNDFNASNNSYDLSNKPLNFENQ